MRPRKDLRAAGRFEVQVRRSRPRRGGPPACGRDRLHRLLQQKGWLSTIKADLAPLTVIPRGFGGSTMDEALHVVDRIVIPTSPARSWCTRATTTIAAGHRA
jgi:hypothetical protein